MLTHPLCVRYGLMVLVLTWAGLGDSCAYGQGSFLERLEATVRDRLAEASPPGNGSPTTEQASEEELPGPQATGTPQTARPPVAKSVLEGRTSSPLPAARPVPPASTDGIGANKPTASGRIYLGLEAEEITGGGIGVRVTKVSEGSPAWKGGFRTGDRISGVNGFAIANLDSMVERLAKTAPGETVKFLVNRNDRNMELVAVLMDAELASRIAGGPLGIGAQAGNNTPATDGLPRNQIPTRPGTPNDLVSSANSTGSSPWLGVVVNDLTPEFRKQFGLTVYRGAAVTSVAANSPCSKIGMIAGDAIIAVAGTPIESERDLKLWMSTARPGQRVEVTYQRGTAARTSQLTLEVTPESRSANRTPIPDTGRARPNRSAGAPASPVRDAVSEPTLDLAASTPNLAQSNTSPLVPSKTLSSEPTATDVVPNAIPVPVDPAARVAADTELSTAEVAELRREVTRLRAELDKANERLESTQNRLQKIIEGLVKE